MRASIDFETRSLVDIKKTGVLRYAMDPSTDIICMAYGEWYKEPNLWTPGMPFPLAFFNMLSELCAWNAQFEIAIWKYVGEAKYGWPKVPDHLWHDTMGDAAMCAFPLALGQAADALGVHQRKGAQGTRLINLLSKPQKDGTFRTYEDHPDLFHQMYEYCLQDVRTEQAIYDALPAHVEGQEDDIQRLTWLMNSRGVPVDVASVERIDESITTYINHLDALVAEHTCGALESVRQKSTLLMHLEMNRDAATEHVADRERKKEAGEKLPRLKMGDIPGMVLDNLRGETVDEALKSLEMSDYDRQLLQWYSDMNHASVAKYKKILLQLCDDGTVKDNTQYHGAGTGRDAARGLQTQNMPRSTADDVDALIESFFAFDAITLSKVYDILSSASSLIRGMIKAPINKKFVVSDYGQVEARATAWGTKEENILDNFRAGIDPYVAQASSMYGVSMDEVDKVQRQFGKLSILACVYQGAHKALTDFAAVYGLELDRKTANEVVQKFREARPRLVAAWSAFGDAAVHATNDPGTPYQVREYQHAVFQMFGKHLTLELPSGRKLWYPYADVQEVTVNYEDAETGQRRSFKTTAMTCMWLSSYTRKWERRGMGGGNLLQNWVQAISRDLMMHAALNLEARGYPTILRVHDEIVTLVPNDSRYSIKEMDDIMCQLPAWAEGFPIASDGYEATRYRK